MRHRTTNRATRAGWRMANIAKRLRQKWNMRFNQFGFLRHRLAHHSANFNMGFVFSKSGQFGDMRDINQQ